MFAYIPARGGSKRIPRKNLRPLGGKPLLIHVLDALAKVSCLTGIAVSSEDPEILALANRHPAATTLGARNPSLADDMTGFTELLRLDAPRFASKFGDEDVLFVTATAALVSAQSYEAAVRRFEENKMGFVMAVKAYETSPMLALLGDPEVKITPLFPDMYLKPTKDLPPAFVDAGCFYAVNLKSLAGVERLLDLKPVRGVVLPPEIGIDLDTEADWKKLEASYRNLLPGK